MKIRTLALSFVLGAAALTSATADTKPTKAQLAAAKTASTEGKALFDAGKFAEAAAKFSEAYKQAHDPAILYDLGKSFDKAGDKDKAIAIYKTFLADAPAAPQHDEVVARVAELEAPPPPPEPTIDIDGDAIEPGEEKPPFAIQHKAVPSIPSGRPHDIIVSVPPEATGAFTLYYRGVGDSDFTTVAMTPYGEGQVAARIPAAKVGGTSIQYYIETKAGDMFVRSGKRTSPHLVEIDEKAPVHCFDKLDAGDSKCAGPAVKIVVPQREIVVEQPSPWDGRIATGKWIATGTAGTLLAVSVVSYIVAKRQANELAADSTSCGNPPCRVFDSTYDAEYEKVGERYQTVHQVTLVAGAVVAVAAGYLWFRDLQTHAKHRDQVTRIVAPSVGDGFAGATLVGWF